MGIRLLSHLLVDQQLSVVPVASFFFSIRPLPTSFVNHNLIEVVQVGQGFDLFGRGAFWHGDSFSNIKVDITDKCPKS